jgi:hypothetical protein
MLAYEIWLSVAVVSVTFAALYPTDAENIAQLIALAPRLLWLWLRQRALMLRLGTRLAIDGWLLRRRLRRLRRHNTQETTSEKDN